MNYTSTIFNWMRKAVAEQQQKITQQNEYVMTLLCCKTSINGWTKHLNIVRYRLGWKGGRWRWKTEKMGKAMQRKHVIKWTNVCDSRVWVRGMKMWNHMHSQFHEVLLTQANFMKIYLSYLLSLQVSLLVYSNDTYFMCESETENQNSHNSSLGKESS